MPRWVRIVGFAWRHGRPTGAWIFLAVWLTVGALAQSTTGEVTLDMRPPARPPVVGSSVPAPAAAPEATPVPAETHSPVVVPDAGRAAEPAPILPHVYDGPNLPDVISEPRVPVR